MIEYVGSGGKNANFAAILPGHGGQQNKQHNSLNVRPFIFWAFNDDADRSDVAVVVVATVFISVFNIVPVDAVVVIVPDADVAVIVVVVKLNGEFPLWIGAVTVGSDIQF